MGVDRDPVTEHCILPLYAGRCSRCGEYVPENMHFVGADLLTQLCAGCCGCGTSAPVQKVNRP